MSPLFKKLNLGSRASICVLDAPPSFEAELEALENIQVSRSAPVTCDFAIAFAVTQAQLDAASKSLAAACSEGGVLWVAYPKGSSRRYACAFNRDCGWPLLAAAGYEPVRMVAIDEDWTALRFRKVEHIKTMARSKANALSEAGKQKASGRGA